MWSGVTRSKCMSDSPPTFGDYPPTLLKFLSQKEHAEQLLAGSIRLTLLDTYTETEDEARKDTDEGKAFIVASAESVTTVQVNADFEVVGQTEAPGEMNHHIVGGTPTYVLCCTDPDGADIEALKEQFGRWVVRINDPERLGQAVTDALQELSDDAPLNGRIVEAAKVAYDKGEKRDNEPTFEETFKASYSQKDPSFAAENEVRLVALVTKPISKADAEQVITVEIGPLDYAELLD